MSAQRVNSLKGPPQLLKHPPPVSALETTTSQLTKAPELPYLKGALGDSDYPVSDVRKFIRPNNENNAKANKKRIVVDRAFTRFRFIAFRIDWLLKWWYPLM